MADALTGSAERPCLRFALITWLVAGLAGCGSSDSGTQPVQGRPTGGNAASVQGTGGSELGNGGTASGGAPATLDGSIGNGGTPADASPPPEAAAPDGSVAPDAATDAMVLPDAAPSDATVPPDATVPSDVSVPPDGTPPLDGTVVPDAAAPPDASEPPDATAPPDVTVSPDVAPPPDATPPLDAAPADAPVPSCTPEGRSRDCGSNVGACRVGSQVCLGGEWTACTGGTAPTTEICDGQDNDCDDADDEGCPCTTGATRSCGSVVGQCVAGQQQCVLGVWSHCTGNTPPTPEECDGIDNDCNGAVDEGCPCAGSETRACGIETGVCTRGQQTCQSSRWGICADQVAPSPEVCDGLDNDCNGKADDGFACTRGASGVACTTTCGSTGTGACTGTCTPPLPADCTPPAETCNGLDDDCNGKADDGFACVRGASGIACTTTCGSLGTGTCTLACALPAPADCTPPAETCNGLDDDCDGLVDNGSNACGGACPIGPLSVACDSPDDLDDCPDDISVCDGRNAVRCANAGVDQDGDGYSAGAGTCNYDCNDARSDIHPFAPEACNGVDEDCDGVVDEDTGFAPLPQGMIVLMDGACPDGWSEVVAARGRLLRGSNGDAVFGETGGSDLAHSHGGTGHGHAVGSASMPSHTHTATLNPSTPTAYGGWIAQGAANTALVHSHAAPTFLTNDRLGTHTHGVSSDLATTGNAASLPPYREYVLCLNTRSDSYAVPSGAVAMAESSCPSGWAEETALRSRMIRGEDGNGAYTEVGGSDGHTHALDHDHGGFTANSDATSFHFHGGPFTSGFPDSAIPFLTGTVWVTGGYHTHSVSMGPDATHRHRLYAYSGTTGSGSHVPPYREALFCRASASTCPVDTTTALFTQACPAGWSELTQYRNLFLRGDDGNGTPNETGGSAQHSHTFAAHDHSGTTSSDGHRHPVGTGAASNFTNVPAGAGDWAFADDSHTHSGTTSVSGSHPHSVASQAAGVTGVTTNDPAWFEVVVCRRDSGGSGCGDGACGTGEDCRTCPADCGACAVSP
jgi:hypothetical protein